MKPLGTSELLKQACKKPISDAICDETHCITSILTINVLILHINMIVNICILLRKSATDCNHFTKYIPDTNVQMYLGMANMQIVSDFKHFHFLLQALDQLASGTRAYQGAGLTAC